MKKRIWLWLVNLLVNQLELIRAYAWRNYIMADEAECLALADKADTQILSNPFDDLTEPTKVEEVTQVIRRNARGGTRIVHDWSSDMGKTIVEDWSHIARK